MKLLRNKQTGLVRILSKYGLTNYFHDKEEALVDYKRVKRNFLARERNEMLQDLTGTSAAEARRDMGLNSGGY